MNNYLNFNTQKQVAFEYRNASKGFIGDTSKMLAPTGGTVGMAGGGALAGGAVGGAGCTLVLPVIGTVACGTAGAVAGGVFGGMVGAATFC